MRPELIQQIFDEVFPQPKITHADIERELRRMLVHDPEKAERMVGHMYGHAFRKAEEAYAARGSRGRQPWTRK